MNIDYTKIKSRLDSILRDNQTELVTMLLKEKTELFDEMENLYPRFDPVPGKRICLGCGEMVTTFDRSLLLCEECFEDENTPKTVYQWWAIDDHWAKNFSRRGLVVLRAFACCWLGRTWCGQPVEADDDFHFLGDEEA